MVIVCLQRAAACQVLLRWVHILVLQQGRCLYVVALMAVYWMTEVIPMTATALFPLVLMPWLGVMDGNKVATNYLKVSTISVPNSGIN